MTSRIIEILPTGSPAVGRADITLEWPVKSSDVTDIQTSLFWNLESFPRASGRARDLVRILGAAFLADSRIAKPDVSLHRDLTIVVHVEDASPWTVAIRSLLVDLLHWLTGDAWTLEVVRCDLPVPSVQADVLTVDRVQLLSGGLDSLCGAIIGLRDGVRVAFVGLRDSNNAVRHAQDRIRAALGASATYRCEELFLRGNAIRKNHGPRSRSLFYMAVAVLVAEELSAPDVWVPENGFTSINPPLTPARGGTLTTRSTHPMTFHLVRALLSELGLTVSVINPFERMTKGELVSLAGKNLISPQWLDATRESFSCGVGNVQLRHGNPNHNCGLCVACLVRRGSFIGGRVKDPTQYACEELTGADLAGLEADRAKDVIAVRAALTQGLGEGEILSSATWPPGANFDEVLDVVSRGMEELRVVRLPPT